MPNGTLPKGGPGTKAQPVVHDDDVRDAGAKLYIAPSVRSPYLPARPNDVDAEMYARSGLASASEEIWKSPTASAGRRPRSLKIPTLAFHDSVGATSCWLCKRRSDPGFSGEKPILAGRDASEEAYLSNRKSGYLARTVYLKLLDDSRADGQLGQRAARRREHHRAWVGCRGRGEERKREERENDARPG